MTVRDERQGQREALPGVREEALVEREQTETTRVALQAELGAARACLDEERLTHQVAFDAARAGRHRETARAVAVAERDVLRAEVKCFWRQVVQRQPRRAGAGPPEVRPDGAAPDGARDTCGVEGERVDDPETDRLYPDVERAGGLARLLTQRLEARFPGEALALDGGGAFDAAHFRRGDRDIPVMRASRKRLFLGDVWERGVQLARFSTASVEDLITLARRALQPGAPVSALLAARPEVEVLPWARAYELGPAAYVTYRWEEFRPPQQAQPKFEGTFDLVQAASRVPELRQLLPYTSHAALGFSRCTGYPFTRDCPLLYAHRGRFRVDDAAGRPRGEGTLEDVVRFAVTLLPAGVGPAVRGTAHELNAP